MRHTSQGPSMGVVVFVAIIFGVMAGFCGTLLALIANQQGILPLSMSPHSGAVTIPDAGTGKSNASDAGSPRSFAQVADELDESVVNINTLSHQQNPYAWFFGGGSQVVKGLGTGVIVKKDGYILTNYHVVGEAENIKVTVMHGEEKQEYPAELIGGDKQEDLALIKINNAPNLHPVKFGDSDKLRPGEWVMAIGNPFGFEHTVSVGVVSALNRRLPVDDSVTLRGMIQTDASINPGNSGGPLVNLQGEVVGIDTAIYLGGGSGQPQARGIGFAIPSTHAVKILNELSTHRKVQHPYIGIRYDLVDDQIRKTEKLPVKAGVIVRGVYKDGPCGKAGIKKDDIITTVDGKELKDREAMSEYIEKQDIGKVLNMQVKRWDDQRSQWSDLRVRVTVEDMPKDFLRDMTQKPQTSPNNGEEMPQQTPNDNDNNDNNNSDGNGNGNGHMPSFPIPLPF